MHKLRSVTLLCAGICAGVLSTVGITAYAEKQSAAPLPLAEIRQFTSAFNAIKTSTLTTSQTPSSFSPPSTAW